VYRCQNGLAPQYLADDLHQVVEVESRRRLRSVATAALIVSATAFYNRLSLSLLLGRGSARGVIGIPSSFP